MKIRTIPAGITWQRTGGKTWICTIRREPETFVEWEPADYVAQNAAYFSQFPSASSALGGGWDSVFGSLFMRALP